MYSYGRLACLAPVRELECANGQQFFYILTYILVQSANQAHPLVRGGQTCKGQNYAKLPPYEQDKVCAIQSCLELSNPRNIYLFWMNTRFLGSFPLTYANNKYDYGNAYDCNSDCYSRISSRHGKKIKLF